ncbi:Uncharacterised protein [Chryseobacterium carnipullorum]|jgi:hypothetical protein|uniref:Uncharacterized protein n=2 Tax=Chryseobacterium TaxID=59732 RepID=A0A381FLS0_9FLAO|nr:DUF6088 family protein [Chryseobacterium carnipullorum]STD13262.1 Uncharacterised protein [Chryseobacterium carnipullorum]SUX47454.1 Uncharacterised protein [Chryseobacterium indoltheticum]
MQSIDDKILVKIKKAKRGTLFFMEGFLAFGNARAVAKALERLVNSGGISRVARGFTLFYKRIQFWEIFSLLPNRLQR